MPKKLTSRIYDQELAVGRAEDTFVHMVDRGGEPEPSVLQEISFGLNRLTAAVLLVARALASKEEEVESS